MVNSFTSAIEAAALSVKIIALAIEVVASTVKANALTVLIGTLHNGTIFGFNFLLLKVLLRTSYAYSIFSKEVIRYPVRYRAQCAIGKQEGSLFFE